jgi:Protein of unknown function (DUF3800)
MFGPSRTKVPDDITPFPFDGQGMVMALALALDGYFDESERSEASEPLSVAGYIFKPTAYKSFCRDWKQMLLSGPTPTTHFHMTNLYARDYEYKGWSADERAEYLKLAVAAARKHKFCGISILFSQSDFERLAPPLFRFQYSSMYSCACQMALRTTASWMDTHKSYLPIAYAFESGHRFWDEADGILRGIGQYPELKQEYRYRTHFPLDKERSYGLQAADMLAWIFGRLNVGAPQNQTMAKFAPIIMSLFEDDSDRYQLFHPKEAALLQFFAGCEANENRRVVTLDKARKLRLR